ncbi:MAG: hypothetical protein AAB926_00625 [Patescibacteria group bacterium]
MSRLAFPSKSGALFLARMQFQFFSSVANGSGFSLKKLFAIVIENEDIVESYKTIFELCWRAAEEV